MSDSNVLKAIIRQKVGSRDARKLRREGRVPASLQTDGGVGKGEANLNLSVDAQSLESMRRQHVHLFDLDVDGTLESALIRELQWDAFGTELVHVEFRRVVRGVEVEVEVDLRFIGLPKSGQANHLLSQVTVKTLPSNIPDLIEVRQETLEIGTHVKAGDLEMPEGVTIAIDPATDVLVVSEERIQVEAVPEGEEPEEPQVSEVAESEEPPAE